MPRSESLYPGDWAAVAEKDLARVLRNISEDPEVAGFYLQQAAEKYLKAFLLSRGWELKRIHDLATLIDYASDFDQSLASFRGVMADVTDFYMAERYPHLSEAGITQEDVKTALEHTMPLIDYLRAAIS